MPLSIIIDKATGAQKRVAVGANTVAVLDAQTETYLREDAFDAEPSPFEYAWNAEAAKTGTGPFYTALPGAPTYPPRTKMKTGNFMRRLGLQREAILHAVRRTSTDFNTIGLLEALTQWAAREPITDVTYQVTKDGVSGMADVLLAVGQLPEGKVEFTATMLALPTAEED
jgi:hypothetical protein